MLIDTKSRIWDKTSSIVRGWALFSHNTILTFSAKHLILSTKLHCKYRDGKTPSIMKLYLRTGNLFRPFQEESVTLLNWVLNPWAPSEGGASKKEFLLMLLSPYPNLYAHLNRWKMLCLSEGWVTQTFNQLGLEDLGIITNSSAMSLPFPLPLPLLCSLLSLLSSNLNKFFTITPDPKCGSDLRNI